MVVLVFVFLVLGFPLRTLVQAGASTSVALPVVQSFVTNEGDVYQTSQQVNYTLTRSTADAPMPGGAAGDTHNITVTGNALESIDIDYPVAGTYVYVMAEEIPLSFEFGWKPSPYEITVYADGSNTPVVIIKNTAGEKVSTLHWTYVYTQATSSLPSSSLPVSEPPPSGSAGTGGTGDTGGTGGRPQTGDNSQLHLWLLLGGAAGIGVIVCLFFFTRQRKQKPQG